MATKLRGILLLTFALVSICTCNAASVFQPISDSHRSAALELFTPVDGSFGSLEETYEAFQVFKILGIEKEPDLHKVACSLASEVLRSSASSLKDTFYALKVTSILGCKIKESSLKVIASRLQAITPGASSLHDFYYSVGGLVLLKDQASKVDVHLDNADGIFHAIKALSQRDGRWQYSPNNPESSTYAAGMALEALAGVISLASSEFDQSLIDNIKKDIVKLFDNIEKYDDGSYYFNEKIDGHEYDGPLSTTASVIQGLTTFASVTPEKLNLPEDKILGIARFLLGVGTLGDSKELFKQINSLACLESNRALVPLILSLPSSVLSLTTEDKLKVRVSTVLGSKPPSLKVRLVRAVSSTSKHVSVIENQELKLDSDGLFYCLDVLPKAIDVGSYAFVFEIELEDSEHKSAYSTGGETEIPVYITGIIKIDNAEIAILDSDLGSVDMQKKLNLVGADVVSLSANHLQKLRLSFELSTPCGHPFKPHQAFLKLNHVTKVEHIFVLGKSGKRFEIILDFLSLVEKLFYLSGEYEIQLAVGDSVMENSIFSSLGYIELDLPELPEKGPRPPARPVDPYSRYGPQPEIKHIFRSPEKRPPANLSLAFLGLSLLPFIGFLVGLLSLGVNLKGFPTSPVPASFGLLFHVGIASVLMLYVFFWIKLDLFSTLKALGLLGIFLVFVGHRVLSHLASTSAKVKSA